MIAHSHYSSSGLQTSSQTTDLTGGSKSLVLIKTTFYKQGRIFQTPNLRKLPIQLNELMTYFHVKNIFYTLFNAII